MLMLITRLVLCKGLIDIGHIITVIIIVIISCVMVM